jgi:hypothetical protein
MCSPDPVKADYQSWSEDNTQLHIYEEFPEITKEPMGGKSAKREKGLNTLT